MDLKSYFTIFFVGFLALGGMVWMHESAHKVIFYYYGIDSYITYDLEHWGFKTVPEKNCPTEECTLAHGINDAFGYILFPVFSFFVLLGAVIAGELRAMSNELREINRGIEKATQDQIRLAPLYIEGFFRK